MSTQTTYCAYCRNMTVDVLDRSVSCDNGFIIKKYEDGYKRRCGTFSLDNKEDIESRQKDLAFLGVYL